jgi:subtilisin-like proprotein convertase family protein
MNRVTARVFLALGGIVAFAGASLGQTPVTSGPGAAAAHHPLESPTAVTLYSQDDNLGSASTVSQDFETANDGFDNEGADDFVVPAGQFWQVTGVHVTGVYFNGPGPAPSAHVRFYADAAGLPGAPVCSYLDLVPTDTAGVFDLALPAPCSLSPGTYWVSVVAHMDFTPAGEWGWTDRTVVANSPAAWRNPLGGFGIGCTPDWGVKTACVTGASGGDNAFSLSGTLGGVVPPGPPECGETTAYFENATPVPTTDVGVVTSTINVTGMDPYIWDVNATTFLRHTFAADVDMTITSPAGTVVTLTSDNGAGNDDVFNGTVWDDQADPGSQVPYAGNPSIVTDHTYTNLVLASPLVPEEAMGAFIGEDPNGTWTITISDDLAGDNGTLDKWGLQITTLPQALRPEIMATSINNTPVAIPTGPAVVTSTIDMSFSPGTFICGGSVDTSITHTFAADLDITLMSPAGTVVTLTTDNGAGNDNVFNGTSWYDKANPGGQVPYTTNDGLVSDQAYVNLTAATPLVPEEALSAFNGQDPRGIWTLTVSDDLAGDGGSIDTWTLHIITCTCALAVPGNPVRVDAHASSGSSNVNGVLETGETVILEPAWHNSGTQAFTLFLSGVGNFTGPAGATYTINDGGSDYGVIASGATSNCYDATANCYELALTSASRPSQHWDAAIDEAHYEISGPNHVDAPSASKTWTLHVGESFPDVPTSNTFYAFIENIFHNGITGGCAGGGYCPAASVTRAQMAVFLLKAEHGSAYAPPACAGTFSDVACPSLFADWIERLAAEGITGGCGGGNYCPGNPVTRQQMAAFLLKAEHSSAYTPPACTGTFSDVACPSLFADWIERLAAEGITGGCGGGNYCPLNPNTRGQMAVFLVKTFGLHLYGP